MQAVCRMCGSRKLRRSRLRLADCVLLAGLRFPVRCRECRERSFVWVWQAFQG